MKHTIFLLTAFCFLGMDSLPDTAKKVTATSNHKRVIRPTMEQEVQLAKSKLRVLNSEVSVGIAELKFED